MDRGDIMLIKILSIILLAILLGFIEILGKDVLKTDKSKLNFIRIIHIVYGYIAYAILNG